MLNVIIFCMQSTLTITAFVEVATSFTETDYQFTSTEGWTIINPQTKTFSNCGGTQLIGGYEGFRTSSSLIKLFTLPPHYIIKIAFTLYVIDNLASHYGYLFIDSQEKVINLPVGGYSMCGGDDPDNYVYRIFYSYHSSPTATIMFQTEVVSQVYWGIRGFSLSLELCPKGCLLCHSTSQSFECTAWVLVYSGWSSYILADFNDEGWQLSSVGAPTACADIPIQGGYQSMTRGSDMTKKIKLPPHNKMTILFKFFRIDLWQAGEQLIMLVDQIQVLSSSNLNTYKQNLCGGIDKDMIETIKIEIDHSSPTATIFLTNNLYQNTDRFFGIRDFQIYVQKQGNSCGDGILDKYEQCEDDNNVPFDGCYNCQYSCCEGCSNCVRGICYFCRDGWIYDSQSCYQEIKNEINIFKADSTSNQLVNINCNEMFMNECIKCQKGWQLSESGVCIPICGDGIIVGNEQCEINQRSCNNICEFKCQTSCKDCRFGKCIECQDGYESINGQCQPICNDQLKQIEEQCEDNNDIRFDGCYNCKNQCQDSCLNCQQGQCMMCQQGWILNNGKCEQHCGDQLIAIGLEECDDGSTLHGCQNCKLQCIDNCNVCFQGVCYQCIEPYALSNQKCQILCGDGIISKGYEQCDDGNDIPYDGCYNCEYQCNLNCQNCNDGKCMDICEYGYYLINEQCESICGDGIIANNEQCDDQNDYPLDGCYKCQYQCDKNCQICDSGICQQCLQGYELFIGQCQSKCGDGIIAQNNEECDDFNNQNLDGCNSQCSIEINWICSISEDSFSQCSYNQPPQMLLTFIKQEFAFQYVQLSFSQQIRAEVDDYVLNATMQNLESYIINIIEIKPINQTLNYAEYMIQIEFTQQIDYKPTLQVNLLQSLFNADQIPLDNYNSTIKLQQPLILGEKELEVSENIQQVNEIILYSSCGLCLILIALGNISLFFEILDILQQQSFLKFVNVQIPQNLYIYFESSNALTFQPILNFLQIDNISNKLVTQPFIEAKYKFREYEINVDILQNIQAQLLMIISSLILRITLYCIIKQMLKIRIPIKEKRKFKIYSQITISLMTFYKSIITQGFKFMVYANSFDLLFASTLQLTNYTDIYRASTSISIILLIFFVVYTEKEKRAKIIIMKKALFIFVLVLFQSSSIIQIVLLAIIYTFYISTLLKQKVLFSLDNLKSIIPEFSIFIFLVFEGCHREEFSEIFKYKIRVILAWVQIGVLSFALLQAFLILGYQQMKKMKNKFFKYLNEHHTETRERAQMPLEMIKN